MRLDMFRFTFIIVFCFLVHYSAWSNSNSGSTLSQRSYDEKHLESILTYKPFVTTGKATFSILFWDLYKSHLRTTSGTYPISLENEQLIFHIDYLADISNEDLIYTNNRAMAISRHIKNIFMALTLKSWKQYGRTLIRATV